MDWTMTTNTIRKKLLFFFFLFLLGPALFFLSGCNPSPDSGPPNGASKPEEKKIPTGGHMQSPFQSRNVNTIIAIPGARGGLYASVAGQGIFKSSDNGGAMCSAANAIAPSRFDVCLIKVTT